MTGQLSTKAPTQACIHEGNKGPFDWPSSAVPFSISQNLFNSDERASSNGCPAAVPAATNFLKSIS